MGELLHAAFLEVQELAFAYFGGVFCRLHYDNLKSELKKILRGYQREETIRLIAFRSYWGFTTDFCNPGRGNVLTIGKVGWRLLQ